MVQKKGFALSFLILTFFLLFGTAEASAEESRVKVGLYWGSSARGEYKISAQSPLEIGHYADKSFICVLNSSENAASVCIDNSYHVLYGGGLSREAAAELAKNLSEKGISAFVRFSKGEYSVAADSFSNENDCLWAAENLAEKGSVLPPESGMTAIKAADGKFLFMSDADAAAVSENGKITLTAAAKKEYRGGLSFSFDGSALTAINILDTEQYLYSVISKEMSPSWNKEALKAQAVCARCYAYNNRQKHAKSGFELCDTVCCQAYAGTAAETASSYAPVDETRGQYLLFGGKVCETFYCSSTGPTTENVKYVWGSEYPYLVSVDNPYEDYENVYNGKWENTLTKQRATEIMASKGYGLGEIEEIKALEFSPSGRVIKLLVKGTSGEKIFEKAACRSAFSEVTPSQYYTISGGGGETVPGIWLQAAESKAQSGIKGKKIISENGIFESGDALCATDGSAKKTYAAEKSGEAYVFSGFGWGHGIGMSQYGAKGMADAGFDYKAILTHYFPGTQIGEID